MFYVCTANPIQSPEYLLAIYLYTSAGFGSELMTVVFMRHIILVDRLVVTEVVFLGDNYIIMHMFGNRKKVPLWYITTGLFMELNKLIVNI